MRYYTIADVHGIEVRYVRGLEDLFIFEKFSDFHCVTPET